MTLLITLVCAIVSTIVWYFNDNRRKLKLSVLCFEFWGASLMWLVDSIFEFVELKAEYFNQPVEAVASDTLLGLAVAVLGLLVWVITLIVSDPNGVIKKIFNKKEDN